MLCAATNVLERLTITRLHEWPETASSRTRASYRERPPTPTFKPNCAACRANRTPRVEGFPGLAAIVEPLLSVRRVMCRQFAVLHKMLLDMVRSDPVCRRLMTGPGVGALVALTYGARSTSRNVSSIPGRSARMSA